MTNFLLRELIAVVLVTGICFIPIVVFCGS